MLLRLTESIHDDNPGGPVGTARNVRRISRRRYCHHVVAARVKGADLAGHESPEALLSVPLEAVACTINTVAESGELGDDGGSSGSIALLAAGLEVPITPPDPGTLCAAEMVFPDSDAGSVRRDRRTNR